MVWERIVKEYVCSPSKVAVLGATIERGRPVSMVMRYLKSQGFSLYPVNPKYRGLKILGLSFYASVRDIPENVDILSLFIGPKNQAFLLDELKSLSYKPIVWMQPGAENQELEEELKNLDYTVVSGQCIRRVAHVLTLKMTSEVG
ncbi:CoA-binding protein [Acetomicrobium sp.]|uniref:CoA-binding protein n=1 Tax=Acetomicrobium sp. TaxID=1872099 RepID=UPI002B25EEA6|nr:CoA-binding protein [Acetomicrobium sp.]